MTLPNFIIAGVPRGGTTSLQAYLRQHPDVYICRGEPRYFLLPEDNFAGDIGIRVTIHNLQDYLALFDEVIGEKAIGEKSPFYIFSEVATHRIRATIPEAKIIMVLRNPVERAYSGYWLAARNGNDVGTLEEYFADLNPGIWNGGYSKHLSRWYDVFPGDQLKVIIFDDLKTDSLKVYQELCQFLEIDETFVPDLTRRNQGGAPQNQLLARFYHAVRGNRVARKLERYVPSALHDRFTELRLKNISKPPRIPDDLAQKLGAYYRDDIVRLEDILQRNLSSWKGDLESQTQSL
jgi:hypothetical protein